MSRLLVSVVMVTWLTRAVAAHDLGVTHVTATFRDDGTYQVQISVDPDALFTRLELADGVPLASASTPEERDRRIAALSGPFLNGIRISVDGRNQSPVFRYRPAIGNGSAQLPAMVTLTGSAGRNPRWWTLEYDFALGWFPVETSTARLSARETWIEGGKPSPSMSIAAEAVGERAATTLVGSSVVGPMVLLGIAALSRYRFGIVQK